MKKYFLFGEEVCRVYAEDDNWKSVLKAIDDGIGFDTYVWDDENHDPPYPPDPVELLFRYQGWNDYAVITEKQYKSIYNH